jgi:hypothetical protein
MGKPPMPAEEKDPLDALIDVVAESHPATAGALRVVRARLSAVESRQREEDESVEATAAPEPEPSGEELGRAACETFYSAMGWPKPAPWDLSDDAKPRAAYVAAAHVVERIVAERTEKRVRAEAQRDYAAICEALDAVEQADGHGPNYPSVDIVCDSIRDMRRQLWERDEERIPKERASWHEEDGSVLWWTLPVSEAPYAGTPLDDDFPEYATHWTRIAVPFGSMTDKALNQQRGELQMLLERIALGAGTNREIALAIDMLDERLRAIETPPDDSSARPLSPERAAAPSEEELGRLNYEAWCDRRKIADMPFRSWEMRDDHDRASWSAAAHAVERVVAARTEKRVRAEERGKAREVLERLRGRVAVQAVEGANRDRFYQGWEDASRTVLAWVESELAALGKAPAKAAVAHREPDNVALRPPALEGARVYWRR